MMDPDGETREQREKITKQALAAVMRRRMIVDRRKQTELARESGVSRTMVQYVLRGDQNISLFLFLELSHGMKADACELLRDVLSRRAALRGATIDK